MSGEVKLSPIHALGVLRNAPFRRYVIGSLISDTGSWMQVMAQGWVMATLTNKAIWLGMANLAAGLPMLLLTMVGGAAADRFDKRKILLITQFVQIGIACGIGFLILKGQIEIWQILAFAVMLGISNSFEMPTQTALVPELVGRAEIQNGISIDRSVFHGSRVLGPTVGGYLINWLGKPSAFFANALSFVALIIAIWSLPPRPKGTAEEEEKRASGIKDGFRFERHAESCHGHADCDPGGLHFPDHHSDDATLCAARAPSRRGQFRLLDGRICHRLVRRLPFLNGF